MTLGFDSKPRKLVAQRLNLFPLPLAGEGQGEGNQVLKQSLVLLAGSAFRFRITQEHIITYRSYRSVNLNLPFRLLSLR